MKKYNGQSSNFVYKRTVNIVLIDVLASSSGVGERHDLQRPGRLQQAASVRAQRNAEGGQGGISIILREIDTCFEKENTLNIVIYKQLTFHRQLNFSPFGC